MSEYCKNCKQLQERVDELNGAIEEWLEEEESWKRLEAGLLARVEELEKEIQGWKKLVLEMGD